MNKILIIGASKGIGAAIAALLQPDLQVLSISRSQPEQEVGEHYQCDVLTDPLPSISDALAGLVYCPGSIHLKPFSALKTDDFRYDFELNVLGAVRCLKQYHSNLRAADSASVVLFSSVAAQTGFSYHSSIAASKAAVEGLTRALAAEWAPNIRVNAIAPSLTKTGLSERLLSDEHKIKAAADKHALKRVGEPNDIAQMAAFLLSANTTWITGQVFHVDGGMSVIK
ncbi:MAG: SDR family oxidoreductase [Methylococcales bacterium]